MKVQNIKIVKRNGNKQDFDPEKIKIAIRKSAERAMVTLTPKAEDKVVDIVMEYIKSQDIPEMEVNQIHNCVEAALEQVNPLVAKSYRDFRNYKQDFVHILDKVYQKAQAFHYIGDKDNGSTSSALVSTQRSLTYHALNKELYKKFFLTREEVEAIEDGYIYIHNTSSRRDTFDSCVCDMASILKDGFEMSNLWYNEPNTLQSAFQVMGDVIIQVASEQYGGFTVPEVDTLLIPYAKKSFERHLKEFLNIKGWKEDQNEEAKNYAEQKTIRECEQGYQAIEYKLNSIVSSRGDYPFITFTLGHETDPYGKEIAKTILKVHEEGEGQDHFKRPTLFPKLVFLYDEKLHGKEGILSDLFELALDCTAKTMYPDYLSLSGKGFIAEMYQKYNVIVSPMGSRAFLSPWYKEGGLHPKDSKDKPVFTGRCSIGTISLNLPMILEKSKIDQKEFYEVLDFYLEMIRKIHLRTFQYLGKRKASTDPVVFMNNGFFGGNLKPNDGIESVLKSATASFGITALNELQELYNNHSLKEDTGFALETMHHINEKINSFQEQDGRLYTIYGTPDESLCELQIDQFRKKYGLIPNVSTHEFMSNSFHTGVWEEINGIEKQDIEEQFWDLFQGGRIQYVTYDNNYNKKAMRTYIERAMSKGFYEAVSLSLSFCNSCGYHGINVDVCPKCGSNDLIKMTKTNGYLSYSKIYLDTHLNRSMINNYKERK